MSSATIDKYRLPPHVVPSAYRLRLDPDLDAATFSCTVDIDLDVSDATSALALNAIALGGSVLFIAFRGILNDQLRGFYRSTFTDENGTSHLIATTQFESTDAR